MKNRLPTVLSATALVVALMGPTGIANAVVVSFAANAGKLSGFKASKTAKKNTVVVRGKNGKIDAGSIPAQAGGPPGIQGVPGPKGDPGAIGGRAGGSLAGTYPNPSLAANSVGTSQIADRAVNAAKVADGSLTGTDLADGSLTGADMANDSLSGAQIVESSLGQVPSALLGGFGRSARTSPYCNPTSLTLITCTTIDVNLPAATRVLLTGLIAASSGSVKDAAGTCELGSSVIDLPSTSTFFEVASFSHPQTDHATLVAITPPVGPGNVQFRINCNQSIGDIMYWGGSQIAVVALSPS